MFGQVVPSSESFRAQMAAVAGLGHFVKLVLVFFHRHRALASEILKIESKHFFISLADPSMC